jgi:hypothetical protein
MKVRNVSGVARGVTPAGAPEFEVDVDETVDVDDVLGKSLCEQPANWQQVSKTTTKESV